MGCQWAAMSVGHGEAPRVAGAPGRLLSKAAEERRLLEPQLAPRRASEGGARHARDEVAGGILLQRRPHRPQPAHPPLGGHRLAQPQLFLVAAACALPGALLAATRDLLLREEHQRAARIPEL